jgi:hypothetical protein
MMAQDCFRCELGDVMPQAQAEIGAVRYFTLAEFQQLDTQVIILPRNWTKKSW